MNLEIGFKGLFFFVMGVKRISISPNSKFAGVIASVKTRLYYCCYNLNLMDRSGYFSIKLENSLNSSVGSMPSSSYRVCLYPSRWVLAAERSPRAIIDLINPKW